MHCEIADIVDVSLYISLGRSRLLEDFRYRNISVGYIISHDS